MQYVPPLIEVRLLRRYKRFLVDIYCSHDLAGSEEINSSELMFSIPEGHKAYTVHCANPGRMQGLINEGQRAWIYDSQNPKRKLRYSLELIETEAGELVCINTARANGLVGEVLGTALFPLVKSMKYKAEVPWKSGKFGSRFDFAFWSETQTFNERPLGYLEVKSVTYALDQNKGWLAFPDAVTSRGLKHLEALIEVVNQGYRAILCFCTNHNAGQTVTIAEHIDPQYAQGLRRAIRAGVEVYALKAHADPHTNQIVGLIPFIF